MFFWLSESNFALDNIVIRYKADFIEEELIKENLIEASTEKDLNVKNNWMKNRVLLRFEFHVPHQILYTTLAADEKWSFHIFYQNSEISWQKMPIL